MFRHVRWQVTLIVVGILVLAGLMGYLAMSFTTRYVAAPGGTYVEGVIGQPQYLDPLLCSFNDADRDICSLVFNGLLKFNARGEPQSDLAQTWSVSDDEANFGLIYTFNLRADVVWQDGQPFTADDVIFTINLLKDPDFPGRPDIGALWRSVEAVKVNNYTVQITLQEPYAPFLDYTAIGMLPAHILNGVKVAELFSHPFNRQPIGTGPFRVVEFTNAPGRPPRVVLETNPRYFGRQPYINKLEFKYYSTPAEAFTAYRAGEVQGIAPITLPADFDLVRSTPSLNLFTAPISGLTLIFLNTDDVNSPFFQEKEVRQALLLALDRQAIVDVGIGGQGTVADVPFQPDSWARPDVPRVEQDIGKARTLLDKAGWISPVKRRDIEDMPLPISGGSDDLRLKAGVPLSFTLLTSAEQVDVARQVARQWKVIGVNAQVQPVQIGLASNYLQARQYQAAVANILLDTPDPDPYPFWHETRAGSGQNYSQFKDRDLSEVLEASRRVVDRDRRAELYAKFVEMFNEQVPSILLYYPVYSYGVSERIRGVQLGSMLAPSDRFQTLADWFVIERRVIVNSGQFAP